MTKQVKVFSGSSITPGGGAGTTTVYTVPAGRVAKVTLRHLIAKQDNSSAQPMYMTAGVATVFVLFGSEGASQSRSIGFNTSIFSTTYTSIPVPNGVANLSSPWSAITENFSVDKMIPVEFFLNAGESVSFTSAANNQRITYSMCAVEEY